MKKISKYCFVYAVMALCGLNSHVASAWIIMSDVDSDSAKWSKYNTYSTTTAGADRWISYYDNMFVRVWAGKDKWSSAGRTVSIPYTTLAQCHAQITHTGASGIFYVRDSATMTTLSPIVNVAWNSLTPNNPKNLLGRVSTSFSARNKNVFARFYMTGGIGHYGGAYGGPSPHTAYIDDLIVVCN